MKTISGTITAKGKKIGIIAGRFNDLVTTKLVEGAVDCIVRHDGAEDAIEVVKVPGAFEIPQMLNKMAAGNRYDAIICVGAVIRGETPHFDYIAAEVTKGIAQVAMTSKMPISYGVLTTDTLEQALDRAGAKAGNKGWDAALSVLEMSELYKTF